MRYVDMMAQGYSLYPGKIALQPRSAPSSRLVQEWFATVHLFLQPYADFLDHLLAQSVPLTHPTSLNSLRDMYNSTPSSSRSSLSSLEDINQTADCPLDQIDLLISTIHSRRRQWFMHLLALEIMTRGHDSARPDYDTKLNAVHAMMLDMRTHTEALARHLEHFISMDQFQDCLAKQPAARTDNPKLTHRSRMLSAKLEHMEKQIRQLHTKLTLCRHEIKRPGILSLERVHDRFVTMDHDLSQLRSVWDEALTSLTDTMRTESLPSPPYSPAAVLQAAASSSLLPELPTPTASNRQSWMTMATNASFNESRRMYRLHQRRHDNPSQESLSKSTSSINSP
ncbi:hypothetical protein DM01DRAFT_168412 [Hesseltinella vesiculosa]|uniref:Myosin-binding domain-containing protein n=1 Tax=Hesseltinella vesiculosa TaxID=101127 RepID=A0A1X2GQX9_9FUNG|nr:hypothetical protein DM01DRAFT_168412 [Hesseltinella vesiculosa]